MAEKYSNGELFNLIGSNTESVYNIWRSLYPDNGQAEDFLQFLKDTSWDDLENKPFYDDRESGGELKKLDEKYIPVTSDDEVIDMLVSLDILIGVSDENGNILTDESENILLW